MLPGFRFLFAAIVLSTSILIFGLGAAALLRASHDQFVSIPARRPLPEPVFAQQIEPSAPTLALLRVEPSLAAKAPAAAAIAALVEQPPEAVPVPPVETERLAALRVDEPVAPETARPETAARAEPAPSTEAAAVEAAPDTAGEIKVAAVETATSPAATDTASAALPPVIMPPAPESMGAPTRIAALASPAATVGEPASATPRSAQLDKAAIRKQRLRAQRAKERRRLAAQRARLARQAAAILQQQQQQQQQPPQSDPFTPQPTITAAPASRRR
jgi:hypothetical protein